MNKYKKLLIGLNLLLVVSYFVYSIVQKEHLTKEGQLVLLRLAPVDPRSLMQGDYMNLRYAISREMPDSIIKKRGYCIVELDSNNVGHYVRLQADNTCNKNEYALSYLKGGWRGLTIGAESFFFEEGTAEYYEEAVYGGLKIDGNGNSLLIGLYNENRQKIQPVDSTSIEMSKLEN